MKTGVSGTSRARPQESSATVRQADVVLAAGTLATVFLAMVVLAATGRLDEFLSWAWERHHNVLSWYVRPLFILPLAYFSYKRSLSGIVLTLVALATSMFWFPVPERVDPRVEEFLAFEREWLTGEWTTEKVVSAFGVPLILGALCLAFWKRSFMWGLFVINAIAVSKLLWGVVDGGGTGWVMTGPALTGLGICDAVVLYAARRMGKRSPDEPPRAANHRARSGVRRRCRLPESRDGIICEAPTVVAAKPSTSPPTKRSRRRFSIRARESGPTARQARRLGWPLATGPSSIAFCGPL